MSRLTRATLLLRHPCRAPPWSLCSCTIVRTRRLLHGLPPPKDEYVEVAEYPELPKYRSAKEKEASKLADFVGSLRTVEERLWYLNKPKYFGWHSIAINPDKISYGSSEFLQAVTRTYVVDGLPERYHREDLNAKAAELARLVAPRLHRYLARDRLLEEQGRNVPNDRIEGHEVGSNPWPEEYHTMRKEAAKDLVRAVHHAIHSRLRHEVQHLRTAKVDYDSRTEAFWFKAGFNQAKKVIHKRLKLQEQVRKKKFFLKEGKEVTDESIFEKTDTPVQIFGTGIVKIRSPKMILPFASTDDPVCRRAVDIPNINCEPRGSNFPIRLMNAVNNPGYWTCSRSGSHTRLQFSLGLNFYERDSSASALERPEYREDLLVCKGLLHSFGVALPEACYLGFGPFHDPQSPLAVQTVVTDGRKFKLFAFQLNKTALHVDLEDGEPNNVLWHSPEFDLLVRDDTGEEVVNMHGLKELIKFYLEEPVSDIQTDVMTWDQIKSNYNREYFFHDFRNMQARAFRGKYPEILAWERLYRIQFPQIWFPYGFRDRPWYQMAKMDFKGREHWHPGFKHWDHYETRHIPQCERPHKKAEGRMRKIVPPVPDQDQDSIFWRRPTHPRGPSDDDWRNE